MIAVARRPSQVRGGFSPAAAAALIEQVAGAFDVSAGVIDFDDAPWSEVIHRYSWRRAPRISLAGLPEPMRRELAWWLCSLHSGGERVTHTSVRAAIEYLFQAFERTGSAHAVVKQFAAEQLRFPGRHAPGGPHAGDTYRKPLRHDLVLFTLHNPRYAGAYFYGRRKQFTDIDGHARTVLKPQDQWTVLIKDAHPGYITFEQYERNLATLQANAAARGEQRRSGPAREGPALLQGLVVCGKCGKRMVVNYHTRRNGEPVPNYHCRREGIATGTPPCQTIHGAGIDAAVAALVLGQLTPLAIETALAVSTELASTPDVRAIRNSRAASTA